MIGLNHLPKTTAKKKKRVGRGYGSGVGGHTTTRGQKGFKARSKVPLTFDGSKIKKSWVKRLPFLRGKARQKGSPAPLVLNINDLAAVFSKGQTVNLDALFKKGLIGKKSSIKNGVKILGRGKIDFPLEVALPCSKKAEKKIIKAGGKIANEKMV
ncbi:MAG: 50S ribosomal protein L15 [Patescibacteria group bacterium]|nr:50S ribosomal protein L15 [Patescibacteria group bacterium]